MDPPCDEEEAIADLPEELKVQNVETDVSILTDNPEEVLGYEISTLLQTQKA